MTIKRRDLSVLLGVQERGPLLEPVALFGRLRLRVDTPLRPTGWDAVPVCRDDAEKLRGLLGAVEEEAHA